jgi:hypothetical protein
VKRNIIVAVGILSFLFGAAANAQPPAAKLKPEDAGRALRQMMLTTPPAQTGEKPSESFPRVYGILMDWPIGKDVATIFSSSAGAASLYTTSTFGVLGGEEHASVRAAAIKFVHAADRLFDASTPTTAYPYPAADRVHFYLLTFDGVRVVDADLVTIMNHTSKYTEFFDLGQAVLTELRLVVEERR